MTKLSLEQKKKALRIADAILTVIGLLMGLQGTYGSLQIASHLAGAGLFFTLSLSRLCAVFLLKGENKKKEYIKEWCAAVAYFITALLFLLFGSVAGVLLISSAVYLGVIIVNRVFIIAQPPKKLRRILPNALLIAFLALLFLVIATLVLDEESTSALPILLSFVIVTKSLIHIIETSFSQIKLNVLRKILRKTYASEILFGLLLLIISFSFVFQAMESGIETYFDALWYSFAVVTTIGFGDVVVTGGISRFLSVILGIYGIIVVALITSIIINFYNETKSDKPDDQKDDEEPEKPDET